VIRVKRIYEHPSKSDGYRVLVDRIWPRGVSKRAADIDEWMKEIAPSTRLRKWFGHDPGKWLEFKKRYFRELGERREEAASLRNKAEKGLLTLVYAAKDEEHNNAMALCEFLSRE
jgi:uncharacterized protein YeaO (DUF488 family)